MSAGLDNLKHIVVLMMENRSFDHMLGALKQKYPKINGLTGNESNPDTKGAIVKVQPNAQFQSQLDPDPDHHFPGVDLQIFGAPPGPGRVANMQGFVKDYFSQTKDVNRSHNIMYYFTPDKQNTEQFVVADLRPLTRRGAKPTVKFLPASSALKLTPAELSFQPRLNFVLQEVRLFVIVAS